MLSVPEKDHLALSRDFRTPPPPSPGSPFPVVEGGAVGGVQPIRPCLVYPCPLTSGYLSDFFLKMEDGATSVSRAENTFPGEAEGSANWCIWVCVDVGLARPTFLFGE